MFQKGAAVSRTMRTARAAGEPAGALSARDAAVARPVTEFVGALNRGDVDAAVAWLAPGALHHGAISNYTPDGVRVLFTMLREVFPDLRLSIVDQRVEGHRVISRIAAYGTHTGSYLGRPPTGEAVAWVSTDIAEVDGPRREADGDEVIESDYWRILKRFWDLWSDPELFKRIGFMPAIAC